MFGYVRTHTPELRVREYEAYRATYCGLCRAMGKCTGQCSRMTLNYDFAFLALVRLALTETPFSFEQKRCLAHPLKRRSVMVYNGELALCARASAVLAYHKTLDDVHDERGAKRLVARAVRPWLSHMRRRALRGQTELIETDGAVAACLARLGEIERDRLPSADKPADAFGDLLAEIVSFGLTDGRRRIAEQLGRHIGRWIYLVDAIDDYTEDVKRGRYNPFALMYPDKKDFMEASEGLAAALKNELMGAERALDLLDFESETHKNVIYNILYLGMPQTVERVLASASGRGEESVRKESDTIYE